MTILGSEDFVYKTYVVLLHAVTRVPCSHDMSLILRYHGLNDLQILRCRMESSHAHRCDEKPQVQGGAKLRKRGGCSTQGDLGL